MKKRATMMAALTVGALLGVSQPSQAQSSHDHTTGSGSATGSMQSGNMGSPGSVSAGLQTTGGTNTVSAQDLQFVMEAARSGMLEVHSSRLAPARATKSETHHFAMQMIQDHTAANEELKRLASARGILLPRDPGPMYRTVMDVLLPLSGRSFDSAYLHTQVDAHEVAVNLFQQQANSGQDPELRAFAQRTLPSLQMHLNMARDHAARTPVMLPSVRAMLPGSTIAAMERTEEHSRRNTGTGMNNGTSGSGNQHHPAGGAMNQRSNTDSGMSGSTRMDLRMESDRVSPASAAPSGSVDTGAGGPERSHDKSPSGGW